MLSKPPNVEAPKDGICVQNIEIEGRARLPDSQADQARSANEAQYPPQTLPQFQGRELGTLATVEGSAMDDTGVVRASPRQRMQRGKESPSCSIIEEPDGVLPDATLFKAGVTTTKSKVSQHATQDSEGAVGGGHVAPGALEDQGIIMASSHPCSISPDALVAAADAESELARNLVRNSQGREANNESVQVNISSTSARGLKESQDTSGIIYVIPELSPPAVRVVLRARPNWLAWDPLKDGPNEVQ